MPVLIKRYKGLAGDELFKLRTLSYTNDAARRLISSPGRCSG